MTFKKADDEGWLEEARRSFERAFAKKDSEGPMTFSQIEELAVQEGQRVARFLLEKKLESEAAKHSQAEEASCPTCGKPAERKQEDRERREIIARPGAVGIERRAYYCTRCRKTFFPGGLPMSLSGRDPPLLSRRDPLGRGKSCFQGAVVEIAHSLPLGLIKVHAHELTGRCCGRKGPFK